MKSNSHLIAEHGTFCIPLYHGTSSLFIDSIQTFGLGGVNPIEQVGGVRLLSELLALADGLFGADAEWNETRFLVQWMVEQQSFTGAANFQHGSAYLTPSRASAVGYALTNRFGSEFVTQTYRVYQRIAERQPQALSGRHFQEHPLVRFFGHAAEPFLVTAHHLPVAAVANENGRPAQASIDRLRDMYGLLEMGVVLNINFRLLTALSPGSVSVELLNPHNELNPYA